MKHFVILHASNTYNNGSFMLLINCIQLLYKKYGNIQCSIEFNTEEDKIRTIAEIPEGVVIHELELDICKPTHKSIISKAINLYHKINSHIHQFKKMNADAVIILGGDDISEYYKGKHIRFDLKRLENYAKGIPCLLLSQSIGPFYGRRVAIARKALTNCRILCREDISYKYCSEKLGIKNAFLSHDLAFLDLPKQVIPTEEKKQIAIVPGGNYRLYTKDKSKYLKTWIDILTYILSNKSLEDHKIILVPHVTRPEDDREMIRYLVNKIADNRIHSIDKELCASELRKIFGESRFTISSRMHAGLSTFNQGKAAILFSHSIKYQGIISKQMELGELIVPLEAWRENKIMNNVTSSLDFVLENKKEIEEKIRLKCRCFQHTLNTQIDQFLEQYV